MPSLSTTCFATMGPGVNNRRLPKIRPRRPSSLCRASLPLELRRTAIANGATLFCAKSDLRGDNLVSILAQLVLGIKSPWRQLEFIKFEPRTLPTRG